METKEKGDAPKEYDADEGDRNYITENGIWSTTTTKYVQVQPTYVTTGDLALPRESDFSVAQQRSTTTNNNNNIDNNLVDFEGLEAEKTRRKTYTCFVKPVCTYSTQGRLQCRRGE
jgi:hypothetical protein